MKAFGNASLMDGNGASSLSSVDSELISPLAQTLLLGFETQDLLKFRNREGNMHMDASRNESRSLHVSSDVGAHSRAPQYEPEPAGATPECDRNGSSPKALAAWDVIRDEEKRPTQHRLVPRPPRRQRIVRSRLHSARRQVRNRNRGQMREVWLCHRPMQLLDAIPAHCVFTAQQRVFEDIIDMRFIMGR